MCVVTDFGSACVLLVRKSADLHVLYMSMCYQEAVAEERQQQRMRPGGLSDTSSIPDAKESQNHVGRQEATHGSGEGFWS